jgi:hypothetical protein
MNKTKRLKKMPFLHSMISDKQMVRGLCEHPVDKSIILCFIKQTSVSHATNCCHSI